MFNNVFYTSLTPLSNMNEITCWENQPVCGKWPHLDSKSSKGSVSKTIKKKTKRVRTAFTTDQLTALEKCFSRERYIDIDRRRELSKILNMREKCIKIWFQNRRMKEKKDLTDSTCDSSSEITGNSMSPPLISSEQEIKSEFCTNPEPEHKNINNQDFPQYEMPSIQIQYNPIHSQQYFNYVPSQNYQYPNFFGNDRNMYPTQHYPNEHEQGNFYSAVSDNAYNNDATTYCSETFDWPQNYLNLV